MNRRDFLAVTGVAAGSLLLPGVSQAAKEFELPKLPYATDALEPNIDAMTMEIHHDKHHAAYVANLNKALASAPDWQGKTIDEVIAGYKKLPEAIQSAVRNNGGGHYNHSLFWQTMCKGGTKPKGELAKAIDSTFKSLEDLQKLIKTAAMGRFGSGWSWLVLTPEGKLKVASSPNQDNPIIEGTGTPLTGIDVWEHAYYLKYQNKRADYIDAWFKVVNWDWVSDRYNTVKKG
ncbi:twin-arginine translocation signal domain-containing protein [Telmatocola sphagniphila]|uniref:Superoxide dismutase n=1 Tax=Telmatocola sphagniphila TaxID=1123043 RepID=A0A8E6EZ39_9BACT|nr:superoxide dismutase [Telmatocola sphagniphila]QVL33026.1 twin-arginine translocation signal domain-containing protein [Telmatocola sphagniphila]